MFLELNWKEKNKTHVQMSGRGVTFPPPWTLNFKKSFIWLHVSLSCEKEEYFYSSFSNKKNRTKVLSDLCFDGTKVPSAQKPRSLILCFNHKLYYYSVNANIFGILSDFDQNQGNTPKIINYSINSLLCANDENFFAKHIITVVVWV